MMNRRSLDRWLDVASQDLRFVVRSLGRSPAFAVFVTCTLALGIGANAALFSVLDRLFLRTPPGASSSAHVWRLGTAYHSPSLGRDVIASQWNYPEYTALAASMPRGVRTASYFTDPDGTLGAPGSARPVAVSYLVGDYFGVLGVVPSVGRFFADDESGTSALSPTAVISYRLWRNEYGLQSTVIGTRLSLGAHVYTIIGVASKDFQGIDLDPVDVWVPRNTLGSWDDWHRDAVESPRMTVLRILANVATNIPTAAVSAAGTRQLRGSGLLPDTLAVLRLTRLQNAVEDNNLGAEAGVSKALAISVITIFAIACANVANLLLVRAVQRQQEIATRLALGVSRHRLLMQFFVEAFVLSALGGLAALVCATWAGQALGRALLPAAHWNSPVVGFRLIGFTALVVLVSAFIAGVVPAVLASKSDLRTLMHGSTAPTDRAGWRAALLLSQVTLSVVLLITGGLLVRTFRNVQSVDLGFDANRLVNADVVPYMSFSKHDMETYKRIGTVLPDVAARIARIPGVDGVALASRPPMQGFLFYPIFLPDRDSIPVLNRNPPFTQVVSADYFRVGGLRLLDGRTFSEGDRSGAEQVIMINTTTAAALWPHERAVGKCIIMGARDRPCRTVIGVVSDSHNRRILENAAMQLYLPFAQADSTALPTAVLIRAHPDRIDGVAEAARSVLSDETGQLGVARVRSMAAFLAPELHPWRAAAELFTAVAALALLVTCAGIYGTVSYMVAQRTHELGVRIALGAPTQSILQLVLGSGLRIVAIGVATGTVIAAALGKVVSSMLYDTSPWDPTVIASVGAVVMAVAFAACLRPAWRATRANPVDSLRAN